MPTKRKNYRRVSLKKSASKRRGIRRSSNKKNKHRKASLKRRVSMRIKSTKGGASNPFENPTIQENKSLVYKLEKADIIKIGKLFMDDLNVIKRMDPKMPQNLFLKFKEERMDFVLIGGGFGERQVSGNETIKYEPTTFTVADYKITWGGQKPKFINLFKFTNNHLKYDSEKKTVTLGNDKFLEVDPNVLRNFYLFLYLILNNKAIYNNMYHIELKNIPQSNTDPSWIDQIYTYMTNALEAVEAVETNI